MANIDAWRRTRPHFNTWSVILDGYEFKARPVSARVVAEMMPRLMDAKSHVEQRAIMRELYRHAFPWRLSYVWRGDPVERLMDQPLPIYAEVQRDFFVLLGVRQPSTAPVTHGTH